MPFLKYSIYLEMLKKMRWNNLFKLCGTTVTCNKKYTLIFYKAQGFF